MRTRPRRDHCKRGSSEDEGTDLPALSKHQNWRGQQQLLLLSEEVPQHSLSFHHSRPLRGQACLYRKDVTFGWEGQVYANHRLGHQRLGHARETDKVYKWENHVRPALRPYIVCTVVRPPSPKTSLRPDTSIGLPPRQAPKPGERINNLVI